MIELEHPIVHVWHAYLPDFFSEIQSFEHLLSQNELQRAHRFHATLHQERFIVAHALLRKTLSLYCNKPPQAIVFSVNAQGKPSIAQPPSGVHFNLSHSHDRAVIAVGKYPLGIDIEKIESKNHLNLAKRFFSENEWVELNALPAAQQIAAFYTIWVKKEAVVKALGEGIHANLSAFSVRGSSLAECVALADGRQAYLYPVDVHPPYTSACAALLSVQSIVHYEWFLSGYQQIK